MAFSTRELLARTIMAEAGNQTPEGMLAVAAVIANRANSGGYGKGIDGVIMKPGQFSAWNSVTGYAGGEQGQNMDAIRPNETAYAAADAVLSGQYDDPTKGALNYYNPSVSQPKWGRKRAGGDWLRIGDHIFGSAGAGRSKQKVKASWGENQPTQIAQTPETSPYMGGATQTAAGPLHTGTEGYQPPPAIDTAAGPLHTGTPDIGGAMWGQPEKESIWDKLAGMSEDMGTMGQQGQGGVQHVQMAPRQAPDPAAFQRRDSGYADMMLSLLEKLQKG